MYKHLEESFDIELFIEEIKIYPEMCNIAAETYHDRISYLYLETIFVDISTANSLNDFMFTRK